MKKKGDIWMPLYISDYLGDTMHLTTAQHGAYLLLLMGAWKRGASLPDNDEQLAQIARCDLKAWRAMRPVLEEFFDVVDGEWTQKRLASEFVRAGGIVSKRKEAGKKGAAKRWQSDATDDGKTDGTAMANAMANGMANVSQSASQTDALSQSPPPTPKNPEAARSEVTIPGPEKPQRAAPPDPVPKPPESPTRRGAVAVLLRSLGVACTYADPTVVEWASTGVPDELLREAVSVARQRKPAPESIPVRYLVPIVSELVAKPVDAGGMRERDWSRIWPDEPAEVSP